MSKLSWDQRNYQSGLDRGVIYPRSGAGEAWNGLVTVTETPSDSDSKPLYVDGARVAQRRSREYFSGNIGAYTYPDSFYEDVVTQTRPKSFGLSYRVGAGKNHKIHLVYNVLVAPSSFDNHMGATQPFNWAFTTIPVAAPEGLYGAHLIIDTDAAYPSTVSDLEDILYGTEESLPRLPLPDEVLEIFEENSILRVIDNGDGTFTVIGPDEAIVMLDADSWEITWPSAVYIDAFSYTLSSL